MVTSVCNGTCTRGSYDHASRSTPASLSQESDEGNNKFNSPLKFTGDDLNLVFIIHPLCLQEMTDRRKDAEKDLR